jgi:hypothetical protein
MFLQNLCSWEGSNSFERPKFNKNVFITAFKPVLKNHPWDPKNVRCSKVVVIQRFLLKNYARPGFRLVVVDRVFGGGF